MQGRARARTAFSAIHWNIPAYVKVRRLQVVGEALYARTVTQEGTQTLGGGGGYWVGWMQRQALAQRFAAISCRRTAIRRRALRMHSSAVLHDTDPSETNHSDYEPIVRSTSALTSVSLLG